MCIRDRRYYDPIAGRITFDGVRLSDLDPADLRAHIALVPQDSVMFATSVRDNIPVSYTHLDVYKRQHQGRSGRDL